MLSEIDRHAETLVRYRVTASQYRVRSQCGLEERTRLSAFSARVGYKTNFDFVSWPNRVSHGRRRLFLCGLPTTSPELTLVYHCRQNLHSPTDLARDR